MERQSSSVSKPINYEAFMELVEPKNSNTASILDKPENTFVLAYFGTGTDSLFTNAFIGLARAVDKIEYYHVITD